MKRVIPDSKESAEFDTEASLREARGRLPLQTLMEQNGVSFRGNGCACPFCKARSSAGIFQATGGDGMLFKCHHTSCQTETKPLDEVGFLMHLRGLARGDAFRAYLQEAGVWKERTTFKSPDAGDPITPELILQATELVRAEGKASVALLQRRLKLGFTRASSLMASLAQRGVVGPADQGGAREVILATDGTEAGMPNPGGGEAPRSSTTDSPSVAIGEGDGQNPSPSIPLPPGGRGDDSAQVDASLPPGSSPENLNPDAASPATAQPGQTPPGTAPASGESTASVETGGAAEKEALTPALSHPTGEGVDALTPALSQPPGEGVNAPDNIVSLPPPPAKVRPKLPPGLWALRDFFPKLVLMDDDERKLFERRGLRSEVSQALGFKSNPAPVRRDTRSNRDLLLWLRGEIKDDDELLASGLWVRKKGATLKPNAQFCGYGIVGRKPKRVTQEEADADDGGEFEWGWTSPILIPYFDANGDLEGLRPHKGMGRAGSVVGTPRLYVPRRPRAAGVTGEAAPEFYETVVITEGEYKAAALWQVMGAGRRDKVTPLGVAALPGISFTKHYEVREELDHWLRRVRADRVIVVFDNEEKGDPKLEGYKPDWRKRHDAQVWARVLAVDLGQKLHLKASVGVIPPTWRDAKGKADWDGMMARIVKEAV